MDLLFSACFGTDKRLLAHVFVVSKTGLRRSIAFPNPGRQQGRASQRAKNKRRKSDPIAFANPVLSIQFSPGLRRLVVKPLHKCAKVRLPVKKELLPREGGSARETRDAQLCEKDDGDELLHQCGSGHRQN